MQKSALYRFMEICISIISVVLTGILFLYSLCKTAYVTDMQSQIVLIETNQPFGSLFRILLCLVAGGLLFCLIRRDYKISFRILFWGEMLFILVAGCYLVLFGRTVPAADSSSVYQMGESLAEGNLGIIHPTDSYLSYYPQQLGLTAFYGIILAIKNLITQVNGYHFIKLLNVLLLCAILYFSVKTIDMAFESRAVTCVYLMLFCLNLPAIVYTSFVYGEIPGLAFFFAALYHLTKCFKERAKDRDYLAVVLNMTLAILVRKNMLIMLIAVIIVCFGQMLYSRRRDGYRLIIIGLVAACIFAPKLLEKGFERAAGREIKTGVTAMSYFAMGMQEAERGPGWYNGFNFNTYRDCGMDTEKTNEISRKAISERLEYFRENLGYALNFYEKKFLTQWMDGTYASRQAVYAAYGGRSEFVQQIYDGKYSPWYVAYCKLLLMLLYLGSFLYSVNLLQDCFRHKEKPLLTTYLPLIALLGGFLFHMIWEANGRYIFPYGQLLYLCAATGYVMVGKKLMVFILMKLKKG